MSGRKLVEVQNVQSEAEKTRAQVTAEFGRIERQLEELRNLSADNPALRVRLRNMRETLRVAESDADKLQREMSNRSGGHYFDKEYADAQTIKVRFSALRKDAGGLRTETDSVIDRARAHLQEKERLNGEIASLEEDLKAEYFADAKGQADGLGAAEFSARYEIDNGELNVLLAALKQLKTQVNRGDLSGADKSIKAAKQTWLELKLNLLRQAEAIVETHNEARIFQKVLKDLGFEYQAEWGNVPHQTLRIRVRGGEGDIIITKDGGEIALDTPHNGCTSLMTDVQNAAQRHGVQIKRVEGKPGNSGPEPNDVNKAKHGPQLNKKI